jgi:hypothetical protein
MKKIGVFLIISAMLVSMMAMGSNINAIAAHEIPDPKVIRV